MTQKTQLLGLSLGEIKTEFEKLGLAGYRAGQVYRNLLKYKSFEEMTDLSKALRETLSERYTARPASVVKKLVSWDGAVKYLLGMEDGELVECVLLRQDYGDTLCVSCQSGCRMGCRFCASGLSGWKRNLTAGEMLAEVLLVNADQGKPGDRGARKITNVVMMGCGEPLNNYDNTLRFLRLLTAEEGLNVSPRNISLSTCGLADRVEEFAQAGIPVTLCLSLHSPFDERRAEIMPIEKKYSIARNLSAFDRYFEATGRRIVLEYTVIAGFNDREEDADELKKLTSGRVCHVNLIPLNRVSERDFRGGRADAETFLRKLERRRISATIRKSAGGDIDGACGQLRSKFMQERERF